MPTQQQDYILRHLQTISHLLARLRLKGKLLTTEDRVELDDVLLQGLQFQEREFGRPAVEFLALSADEQFEALRRSETKAAGQHRCLSYVALLRATAELYAFRDRSDLAAGARQLALHIALRVALDGPTDATEVSRQIAELRRILDGAELHPPTRELLDTYRGLQGET